MFKAWIDALAVALTDAGLANDLAQARAQRAVMLIQGSLVLSRGLGTARPFRDCLERRTIGEFIQTIGARA